MRTMLISLILICSLAQLASTSAPVLVDSGGCGTIYTCFAPEKCLNQATQTSMADSKVEEVTTSHKILDDCDAIIRFYRYDSRKTYVSIESFQDTVKKIEFKQQADDATKTLLGLFSCEFDAALGKKRGIFFDQIVLEEDSSPGKLKCAFEHKRDAPHDGDKFMKSDDFLSIEITNLMDQKSSTSWGSHYSNEVRVRCDYENFDFFRPEDDRTKLYKKISTKNKPEKYECDDTILYKMEYKKKGSSIYENAKEIKCFNNGDKFEVYDTSGQPPEFESRFQDSFEIRCVAETKFFCKDSLKLKDGEEFPKLTADGDGSSRLECPSNKPHLVIKGEVDRYITNPKFECVTLGNDPIWTVKNGAREEIFTKTGPIVYCTDKKNCTQSISESAVEGGTLGPDFLPKCFDGGTLKTSDNKDVTNSRCDLSIGMYKYTAGGEEIQINADTKFICEYPPDDDGYVIAKKDQENNEKILSGAMYAGIGSAIVGIIVIVIVVFIVRRRAKRYKLDYELKQRENQELYYTPKELAAVRQREAEQNKQNHSQSTEKSKATEKSKPKVEEKFNALQTYHQHAHVTKILPAKGFVDVNGGNKDLNEKGEKDPAYRTRADLRKVPKKPRALKKILEKKDKTEVNNGLKAILKRRAGGGPQQQEE